MRRKIVDDEFGFMLSSVKVPRRYKDVMVVRSGFFAPQVGYWLDGDWHVYRTTPAGASVGGVQSPVANDVEAWLNFPGELADWTSVSEYDADARASAWIKFPDVMPTSDDFVLVFRASQVLAQVATHESGGVWRVDLVDEDGMTAFGDDGQALG